MSLPLLQLNVAHTGVSEEARACARKGKRYIKNECRDKTPEEKALTEAKLAAKMEAKAIKEDYYEQRDDGRNPDPRVYEEMLLDLNPAFIEDDTKKDMHGRPLLKSATVAYIISEWRALAMKEDKNKDDQIRMDMLARVLRGKGYHVDPDLIEGSMGQGEAAEVYQRWMRSFVESRDE